MNFWDSSALLPLIIREPSSKKMLDLKEDSEIILTWTLTPVEIISTLCRLQRMDQIDIAGFEKALKNWKNLEEGIYLIKDIEAVKQRATRLLRTHPLKAADALQLASALIACSDVTPPHSFVSLDKQLTHAAAREGFQVLP